LRQGVSIERDRKGEELAICKTFHKVAPLPHAALYQCEISTTASHRCSAFVPRPLEATQSFNSTREPMDAGPFHNPCPACSSDMLPFSDSRASQYEPWTGENTRTLPAVELFSVPRPRGSSWFVEFDQGSCESRSESWFPVSSALAAASRPFLSLSTSCPTAIRNSQFATSVFAITSKYLLLGG
jgi:hypothetical protein